ncbi:GntR family transcriptional regulator [Lacticigenium naphthae]|uniref:GntR family transcriptional regulator n=1 Tax=Lacticigenium naphthae TaxID=515351 RepID=UPI0003FF367E|nr:GntR family transcriptional regulator [Lacticigenium naphthae]
MTEPKYLYIKKDIKTKIAEDTYPLNTKIPSEAELRAVYKVSRHTIRQAISELVNDGLLIKRQGSGTFVSETVISSGNMVEKSKTIGVITTYLSNYIFPSIIRGIESELSNEGYSLMLSSTQNNVANEKESLEKMLNQNVDGLIIEPTKSNLLNPNLSYYLKIAESNIPIVMLHATYEELNAPAIALNDVKAGKIATEHLIELGHKDIAIITKMDDLQGKNRLKGFISAFYDAKLSFNDDYIIAYDTESKDDLGTKLGKLLENMSSPTAFVCYNDQIAISLIHEINKLGKSVPEDFSVVSHDDSHLSQTLPSVKLTTVQHPKEKLGKAAAKWIIQALENPEFNKKSITFEPYLIVRNSTRKYKRDQTN